MFVPNHLVYYLVGQELNKIETDLEYVENGFERQVKKSIKKQPEQPKWNIFDAWNNFVEKNIEMNPDIKGDMGDILK